MFGQERGGSWLIGLCVIPVVLFFPLQDHLGAAEGRGPKEKPLIVTPSGQCRATEIINRGVTNDRGEKLGEVDDLVVLRNGKIEKGVLSVGDFLGVGYRLVAVSFSSLRIDERANILCPVTREQLEKYPVYTYPKDHPYGFYYDPYSFYDLSHELYPLGRERYYPYPMGRIPFSPDQMNVRSLIGRTVINYEGEPIGRVDDFIIRLEEGNIEKIIVSVDETLKEGMVALPFRALELSVWGIYYNLTKRQIDLLLDFKYMEHEKMVSPGKPQ